MMLPAPEFGHEAEIVEILDQFEVAAKVGRRMLADWVMGREEGSELSNMGFLSGLYCS